jgi:hypothetical protein
MPNTVFSVSLIMETAPGQIDLTAAESPSARRVPGSWRTTLFLVALVATAVVTPMFFRGNASGHDFQPHIAQWMDASGQWREGIIFPRWAEWANSGFGEPRFIFYPPGSWLLGAALGSVLPWKIVPGAFIWLTLIAAGMAMWKLAREWLPHKQAVVAAILFAANPYHLVILYYRSDFAELLASAFFPIMIWGAIAIARGEWRRIPLLATAFAAIWLSDAPAAVIATYTLALLLVVGCVARRSLWPLLPGGLAMAAGFGLAACYILPAAWEQRWVQISGAVTDNFDPERNFLFARANSPEFVFFNWKVSTVAVCVMAATAIGIVLCARRRREWPELWWMLVALAVASTFLMFPPSVLVWRYLPEIRFLQFPWRWLAPLNLAFAFFCAAAGRARWQWVWWLALVAGLWATGATISADTGWYSEDIPAVAEKIHSGKGYEGIEGFQPKGCDTSALSEDSPQIARWNDSDDAAEPSEYVQLQVEQWSPERRVFSARSNEPVTLALRLLNYPAWEVRVDGVKSKASSAPDTGQLLVPVSAGAHRIEVDFRRTWDRTAGAVVSILFAIGLFAGAIIARRSGRMDLPP